MNINTSHTNLKALVTQNRKPSALGLKVDHNEESVVEKKNSFTPQSAVSVEIGDSKLLGTDEDMFEMLNQGRSWTIDGTEVAYKDLDKETKTFLFELDKTQKEFQKNNKATDYAGLTAELGNAYAKKSDELTEKYSGDELAKKLESLEKSFNMYTETKIVGNKLEFGSMAHRAHWATLNARFDKYRAEKRQAYLEGKNPTGVKKQDLTKNDDEFLNNLISNAKSTMKNVTTFFNTNGVLKDDTEREKLFELVGDILNENGWSLKKLNATFELLENIDGSNKDRYTKAEFKEIAEGESFKNMFTDEEQKLFKDIFNIYK